MTETPQTSQPADSARQFTAPKNGVIDITQVWDFLTGELDELIGDEGKKEIWAIVREQGLKAAIEKICALLFIEKNADHRHAPFLRNLALALRDPREKFLRGEMSPVKKLFLSWARESAVSSAERVQRRTVSETEQVRKLAVLLWHYNLSYREISDLTGYRENSMGGVITRFYENETLALKPPARKKKRDISPGDKLKSAAAKNNFESGHGKSTATRLRKIEQARRNLKKNEILVIDAAEITGYQRSYLLLKTGKGQLWSRRELNFIVVRRTEIIKKLPKHGFRLIQEQTD